MTRRLLTLLLSLLFLSGSAASLTYHYVGVRAVPQQASKPASHSAVTVPFDFVNKHIVLKVSVNNSRPLSFVLDTGDQYAIINLDRAKELGLKLRGQVRVGGAGAAQQNGAFVDDASFVVAGLSGFSQKMMLALPIGQLAPRLGQDFDGIIGHDFINEFVVEIDYQAHVLRLHNKETFSYRGPGQSIPITFEHGHPLLEAEVTPTGRSPLKGKFVLDIGAGLALALYSPFVNEHALLNDTKTIRALSGMGAGGETNGRIGRVTELRVGNFLIKSPVTLFSEDKEGAFASARLAGNIGTRIASRFKVFLDYTRNRIILEPNASFGNPFNDAVSGVTLAAEGDDYKTFRVIAVLDDSPASEAGLLKGDVVIDIDGQKNSTLTLSRLKDLLEKPVARKLTIRRGESTLEVMIKPRVLI